MKLVAVTPETGPGTPAVVFELRCRRVQRGQVVDRDLVGGRGRAGRVVEPVVGGRVGVQHRGGGVRAVGDVPVGGARGGGARRADRGQQVAVVAVGPGQRRARLPGGDRVGGHRRHVRVTGAAGRGPSEVQRPPGRGAGDRGQLAGAVAEGLGQALPVGDLGQQPGRAAGLGEAVGGAGLVGDGEPAAGQRGDDRVEVLRRRVPAGGVLGEPDLLPVRQRQDQRAGPVGVGRQRHVQQRRPARAERLRGPRVQRVVGPHDRQRRARPSPRCASVTCCDTFPVCGSTVLPDPE